MGRQTPAKVTRLAAGGEPLDAAVAAFLTERDLAPSSHRVYVFTLARLTDHLGPETPVEQVSPGMLAEFMAARYPHLAAASWNRVVATLGSFFAYTTRQGWTPTSPAVGLERHRHRLDRDAHARSRAIPAADLLAFLRAKHPVRDKTLWWLLYESAARAGEVLALDIDDLDLPRRRAVVIGKGGRAELIGWESTPTSASRPAAVVCGMPWSWAAGMKCVPTKPLVVASQMANDPVSGQNARDRTPRASPSRTARAAPPAVGSGSALVAP